MKTHKRKRKLKNKTIKGGNTKATIVVRTSNIDYDELVYNFFIQRDVPSILDFIGTQTSLVDEGLNLIRRNTELKDPVLYRETLEYGKNIDTATRKDMKKEEKKEMEEPPVTIPSHVKSDIKKKTIRTSAKKRRPIPEVYSDIRMVRRSGNAYKQNKKKTNKDNSTINP